MGWYLLLGALDVLVVGNFLPRWVSRSGDAAYVASLVLTFIVAPAFAPRPMADRFVWTDVPPSQLLAGRGKLRR